MEKIHLKSVKRTELIDITDAVEKVVSAQKTKEGFCVVFCPHTTSGVTINENADPSVQDDVVEAFNKLIPENAGYTHQEGNSDSHIKASLFGPSVTVFIEGGQLMLGTWQGIYFCEGDGPRSREVWIKVVKG